MKGKEVSELGLDFLNQSPYVSVQRHPLEAYPSSSCPSTPPSTLFPSELHAKEAGDTLTLALLSLLAVTKYVPSALSCRSMT
jgi:hypothetical protein